MFNLVGIPLTPESRLAAASFRDKSLSWRLLRQKTVVRVLCSSSSSPACASPSRGVVVNDTQSPSSAAERTRRNGRTGRSSKTVTRVASSWNALSSDEAQNGAPKRAQNGAATNRSLNVEVSAKGKWQKSHESSLSDDEPLPLPMTWPNSEPASREKIDKMMECNPEAQLCKDVIYQWTGDCKSCQGTGLVSFYRKRHEVISKCINCLGLGSVHKITSRADIQKMDDTNGNTKESPNGSTRTNGKA